MANNHHYPLSPSSATVGTELSFILNIARKHVLEHDCGMINEILLCFVLDVK